MSTTHRAALFDTVRSPMVPISRYLHGVFCRMHGHDLVLKIEPGRISLQ